MNKVRIVAPVVLTIAAAVALTFGYRAHHHTYPAAPAVGQPAEIVDSHLAAAQHPAGPAPQLQRTYQQEMPVSDRSFRDEESDLQRQKRILGLQVEIADLKKKLDGSGARPIGAAPVAIVPPALTGAPPTDGPNVKTSTLASLSLPGLTGSSSNVKPRRSTDIGADSAGSDFVFLGAMLNGPHSMAIIQDRGSAPLDVAVGTTLSDGWTVSQIDATSVTIIRGRSKRVIAVHI